MACAGCAAAAEMANNSPQAIAWAVGRTVLVLVLALVVLGALRRYTPIGDIT